METGNLQSIDFKSMDLPFQPHVLSAILNLQNDSMMNFHDLENLIKSDQNLTTLMLKIANSSFYYRGNEVKTLKQAIGMIGFQTVISFAMTASLKNAFEAANYSRFKNLVWKHSIVTGVIARSIAEKLKRKELQEEAFIGGTLHDIGKVILNNLDRKMFIDVIDEVTSQNISFRRAELKRFGYDHNEVGMLCIENWKLPGIYKTIAGHHWDPQAATAFPMEDDVKMLLHIVSYGHLLSKKYGYGILLDEELEQEDYLMSFLEISQADKTYYEDEYREVIKKDPFYQFFAAFV